MNNLTKRDIIRPYLPYTLTHKASATAYAPSNIALCKYWGKRNEELNLPINGSLSVSLGHLGTTTTITVSDDGINRVYLNDERITDTDSFAIKVFEFVDLFRDNSALPIPLHIRTTNTVATAAGLASSASGFAALMMALNDFFCLELPINIQSAFARMGSGSASRSFSHGFVEWHKGEVAESNDGMDSYATPLLIPADVHDDNIWRQLRIGLVKINLTTKKINSRSGMKRTVATSHLYKQWASQAEQDLVKIKEAITYGDFITLGKTAEHNALSMHATMISTWPPVLYWQAESVTAMHKVWELREAGVPVYLTMDAGANLKLLFLESEQTTVEQAFTEIEVVKPFIDIPRKNEY